MKPIAYLERDDLDEDLVVIKINRLYREGMSEEALYEATRGIWKRRIEGVEGNDYCLSVFKSEVVEVYKIDEWLPAGTIPMKTRTILPERTVGRVEFIGKIAPDEIRNKYIGKSVAKLFKYGEASPIKVFLRNK